MKAERLREEMLPSVAELERLCFAEPWSVRALGLLLTEEAAGVAVRSGDGTVAAYGGILWAADEGQILNLAVHPDFRCRGLGAMVLSELLEMAKARGCREVSLEVRVSNRAAIALYERAGFYTAGIRRHFYRNPAEDAAVMLFHPEKTQ